MKLLFVQGSAERAGAERMLLHLLKFLDRDRYQPTVLFLTPGPFVDEVRELGIDVLVVDAAIRIRELWRWDVPTSAIRSAIRTYAPDLVHANGEKTSIFAARAAAAENVPCIAWLHDAPGAGGITGKLTQRALKRASPDSVITCSRWMAEAFNKALALNASAISNGIDLDRLPETGAPTGWPDDSFVVGHFARLQRWKGTEVFLRAAALLKPLFPDMRFLVVGGALYGRETSYAGELKDLAAALRISDIVDFTGYRADALELMRSVDVVAHCSLEADPFPTVILEAMAMGRPVIATTTGGPEEAIRQLETGILVPPGDVSALAAEVERLANDAGFRQRLSAAAAKEASTRFAAKRMAAEFERLYDRLSPSPAVVLGESS